MLHSDITANQLHRLLYCYTQIVIVETSLMWTCGECC